MFPAVFRAVRRPSLRLLALGHGPHRRASLVSMCMAVSLLMSVLSPLVPVFGTTTQTMAAGPAPKATSLDPVPVIYGPPTSYTSTLPSSLPTLTPPPDSDYVGQAIAADNDALLARVVALNGAKGSTTPTLLDAANGGRLATADGSFTVGVFPGTVPPTSTLAVALDQPQFAKGDPRADRAGQPLAYTVALTATQGVGGPPVGPFGTEAALIWTLDPAKLAAANIQGIPRVYTFNETTQTWDEVYSYWKAATQQLLARTPHFSLYTVGGPFDAINNYLPSVNSFETNLQSGTATVQYPLNLPAGPGGLAPQVNLSYNSAAGDRVDNSQQGPSNVGWGWTLSMSYIAAAQHHLGAYYNPWTVSIVSEGMNGNLIKGSDGYWHTAEENFARVQYHDPSANHHDDDWWEAWDKSGTHYIFDLRTLTIDDNNGGPLLPNRWMLHTVTDVHGNTLTYSYKYQDNTAVLRTTPIVGVPTEAVYPYQIAWGAGGDQLEATFNLVDRAISGTTDAFHTRSGEIPQRWRVAQVDVKRRQQASNTFVPLRSYRLSQTYDIVLPGTGTATYPHLTLTGITTVGNDGTTTLPPMTFFYHNSGSSVAVEDTGHLYQAKNGYGGQTRYYYTAAGGGISNAYRRVRARRVLDGLDDDYTHNTAHNVRYSYEYRGATLNTDEQSDEAHAYQSLYTARNEFRGYAWARVIDPAGVATEHYFSQDDAHKGQEWRVQSGRTISMTDTLDSGPPSSNWTTSGTVTRRVDPTNPNNWTWALNTTGGTMTRTGSVSDDSTVAARVLLSQANVPGNATTQWRLDNANGNGEYWGMQVTTPGGMLTPKVVWHLWDGSAWVDGSRNLAAGTALRPQYAGPLTPATWYRVQLHPGPDGRFAVELYRDDLLGGYSSVHSGEPADGGGLVPSLTAGQHWRFTAQVTPSNGNNWLAQVDDFSETRTAYSEADTVYTALPVVAPAARITLPWPGAGNSCGGMSIRYVPVSENWTTEFGGAAELGLNRRTRTTYGYDSYGNQIDVYEYGDLAVTGDERSSHSAFATQMDSTHWIVDKRAWTNTYQTIIGNVGGPNFIAQTLNYYDNQPSYGTLAGKGDLTKVSQTNLLAGVGQGQSSDQQFSYDSYGNQTQALDPNGNGPLTSYDAYYHAFPVQVLYPNGRSETTGYDYTLDVPTSSTDMNTTVTQRTYDPMGRPAKTWTIGFGTVSAPNESYSFSDLNYSSVTPPFSIRYTQLVGTVGNTSTVTTTRWFDGRGRVLQDAKARDGSSHIVVNTDYNLVGQIMTSTLPYAVAGSATTAYSPPDTTRPHLIQYYDGAGRVSQTVNPDNSNTTQDYTWRGWVGTVNETVTGRKWQHHDGLGRLDAVWEDDITLGQPMVRIKTGYAYDLLNHQTTVTRDQSGASVTSSVTYDGLGRKSGMTDADMGTWSYGYDLAGNLTSQQDALYNGNASGYPDHQVFFAYDTMNRPTAKYYGQAHHQPPLTPDVQYYYDDALGDANGVHSWGKLRRADVTSAQGANANTHSYEYDPRGLTTAEEVTIPAYAAGRTFRTSYGFDVAGRSTTLTYPGLAAETVTLGYNSQGMGLPANLSSNVSGNPNPVYDSTYNERDQLTQLRQGSAPFNNLLTSAFTYDDTTTKRGWLTNTRVDSATGTHLNLTLGYTVGGNIASMTQTAETPYINNTYTYDGLDRLQTFTSNLMPNESYSFDTLGRMTSRTVGGTVRAVHLYGRRPCGCAQQL